MPGDSPRDGCFSATAQLWLSIGDSQCCSLEGRGMFGRKIQPLQPVLSQRVVFSLLGPAWDLIAREPRSWEGMSPGSWTQQPLQGSRMVPGVAAGLGHPHKLSFPGQSITLFF